MAAHLPDWDILLTCGAAVAERVEEMPGDSARLLAAALAWVLLKRHWRGEDSAVIQRWRDDIPEAMAEIAVRVGISRRDC